jgi:UDP-N-acetylglucosamine 3-dehydrogenase
VTVRVALVGCGTVARRVHLPGLRAAGADVVAFASRSLQSAEAAAGEWGGGDVAGDWHELLGRPDVDAIDICTPNASHAEIATAAAAAGKHVLVEKPLARNTEEADRMIEAARLTGVVLVPAHNARFLGPFVAMREAVARGDVGQVRAFRCAWGHTGPEHWAPAAGWFRDPAVAGGGALIDLGVHAADVLRSVLDDQAVAVSAFLSPRLSPHRDGAGPRRHAGVGPAGQDEVRPAGQDGVEDIAQLVVRFAGGAIGTLQASWALAAGSDHQLTIQGTLGTLHLDERTPPTLLAAGGGDATRLSLPDHSPSVFDVFVEAVATGKDPAVTAADGRAAVALVVAAYRSAASGRAELVEPVEQVEAARRGDP